MTKRNKEDIKQIIIHCSDNNFGNASQINDWHKQRGFTSIGYHAVILNGKLYPGDQVNSCKVGGVEYGRPLDTVGAHCKGQNFDSIGICLIGKEVFNVKQYEALATLIKKYQEIFDIEKIVGHNYYNANKTCPNFNVSKFLKDFVW